MGLHIVHQGFAATTLTNSQIRSISNGADINLRNIFIYASLCAHILDGLSQPSSRNYFTNTFHSLFLFIIKLSNLFAAVITSFLRCLIRLVSPLGHPIAEHVLILEDEALLKTSVFFSTRYFLHAKLITLRLIQGLSSTVFLIIQVTVLQGILPLPEVDSA